jgi:translation initiation factor IF-3
MIRGNLPLVGSGDPADPQKRVRLIDVEGMQLGIMTLAEAERIAQSRQLELVGIASTATPPIYRLLNRRSEVRG